MNRFEHLLEIYGRENGKTQDGNGHLLLAVCDFVIDLNYRTELEKRNKDLDKGNIIHNDTKLCFDTVPATVQDSLSNIVESIEIMETLKLNAISDKETIKDLEKIIEDSNSALASQVKLYHKEVNQLIGVKEHLENQLDQKHELYFSLKEIHQQSITGLHELSKMNVKYQNYYNLPWYKILFTKKPF